jgi:hypothetical protein
MYEYKRSVSGLGALGYSYPRGACSQVNGGEQRCFRPSEESIATRAGCRDTGSACEVSGATGATYCCPATASLAREAGSAAPAAEEGAPAEGERKGVWESITEWFTAEGERVTDRPPPTPAAKGSGAPSGGTPTPDGFAQYAREVAGSEAAGQEMRSLPIEDQTPAPWYQRYQTHITIASTAIGLVTFFGWLALRDKGGKRSNPIPFNLPRPRYSRNFKKAIDEGMIRIAPESYTSEQGHRVWSVHFGGRQIGLVWLYYPTRDGVTMKARLIGGPSKTWAGPELVGASQAGRAIERAADWMIERAR